MPNKTNINDMNERDAKALKILIKNFRGMEERFKNTSPSQFKEAAELFIECLCTAYDYNDFKANEAAIKAYNEVSTLLDERLNDRTERNLMMISHFKLVLSTLMERFYIQAGRQYD